MTATIQAIETVYKGYRFRSRLEARWAVFFETLGIAWRYEEEGYKSRYGYYLPDFRLYFPKKDLWRPEDTPTDLFVEVKGNPTELSDNKDYWTDIHDWGGVLPGFADSFGSSNAGWMLLGSIPEPGQGLTHFHPIIQHSKGLWRSWFMFAPTPQYHQMISVVEDSLLANLLEIYPEDAGEKKHWLVETRSKHLPAFYSGVDRAYAAARSARFEHGENP